MKKFFAFLWSVTKIVVIALAIVIPIRYFLFQPFLVVGQSMEPNFHNSDYLIVDEFSYRLRAPARGDVIVFRPPMDESEYYIKRIIGLPGEKVAIKNDKVTVSKNGKSETLSENGYLPYPFNVPDFPATFVKKGEYFVMGDNRMHSSDSRSWGLLPRQDIVGRVIFRILPLKSIAKISAPVYSSI